MENASTLRTQDMMFAILKQLAENEVVISGTGVLEVLQDGFGFFKSSEANYLPRRMIFMSPVKCGFGLRTGDTVEGELEHQKMENAILLF